MKSSAFTLPIQNTTFALWAHSILRMFRRATSLCRCLLPLRRKLRRSHQTRARLPRHSGQNWGSSIHDMRCTSLMPRSRGNAYGMASFLFQESDECGALQHDCSASSPRVSRRRKALGAAATRPWWRGNRCVESTRQRALLRKTTNHEAVVLIDRSADAIPRKEL